MAQRQQRLRIVSSEIRSVPTEPVAEAAGPAPDLRVSVEVENPTDAPRFVWSSRQAYRYDPATHVLSLYLTEHTPALPPGIELISDHPRQPEQVVVDPGGRATIEVRVPATIRRRVPGEGLGMSFVEEPISQIGQVEFHIQHAPERIELPASGTPAELRARLRQQGQVTRTTVTPTGQKEQ